MVTINLWDIFNLLNYFNTVASAIQYFDHLRTTAYAGFVNAWCSWGPKSWFAGWVSNRCTDYVADVWFEQGVSKVQTAWGSLVLMAYNELVQRKHNTMVMLSFKLVFYAKELIYLSLYVYFFYIVLAGMMPAVMNVLQRWFKSVRDEPIRVRIKNKDHYGHMTSTDVETTGQLDTTSQGQDCTRLTAGDALHVLNVGNQFHTCVVCLAAHADRKCPGCNRQVCCRRCLQGLIDDENMKKRCPTCRESSDAAEMAETGPFMFMEISSANVNRFAHPLLFPFQWIMWVNERAFNWAPKPIQVLVKVLMGVYSVYIIGYYHYYEGQYEPAVFRCAIAHEALIPFLYEYMC